MVDIDKNIPLPPKSNARPSEPAYPFDQMEVGDSFFVAGDDKLAFMQ